MKSKNPSNKKALVPEIPKPVLIVEHTRLELVTFRLPV